MEILANLSGSLCCHGTCVFFVRFPFAIITKDKITKKQKFTRLDDIEYWGLHLFRVQVIIPVAIQAVMHTIQWPKNLSATKLY